MSSTIAVLATTNAYPAAFPTSSSSEINPDTTLALRIPFPGRKGTGGSRNGDAYAIAPSQGEGLNVIWRDRPLLIWDGAIAQVEISDAETGKLLWNQTVKPENRCVAYTGAPLQSGHHYEWKLCNGSGVPIANGVIPFQVLAPEKRDQITAELAQQAAILNAGGITVEGLALERAHYFAKQHLWADLLMEAFALEDDQSLNHAKLLLETVAHITRWTNLVSFPGAANQQVYPETVQIQAFSGEGSTATAARLQAPYSFTYKYDPDEGDWEKPIIRIKMKNNSQQTIFVALLDFAERFSIRSLSGKRAVKIKAGQELWLDEGEPLEGIVPNDLWEQGITEYRNTYKLIACTTDFDPTALTQRPLHDHLAQDHAMLPEMAAVDQIMAQAIEKKNGNEPTPSNLGSKLLGRTRGLWGKEATDTPQWFSSQVALTFIHPKTSADLENS